MKYLYPLSILLIALPLCVTSQNLKEVYGNFIVNKKVFQYRFEEHNHLFQLEISKVSAGDDQYEFPSRSKIDSTIAYYQAYRATLTTQDTLSLDSIITMVKELGTAQTALAKINGSRAMAMRQAFIDTLPAFKGFLLSKGISPDGLISMKELLEFSKTPDISQKASFNLFTPEIFSEIFKMCLVATDQTMSSAAVQKEVNEQVNAIYYSVKSRLDFLDDEPVTAHIQLVNNLVNVKYQVTVKDPNTERYRQLGWWKKRKMRRTTKKSWKAHKEKLKMELTGYKKAVKAFGDPAVFYVIPAVSDSMLEVRRKYEAIEKSMEEKKMQIAFTKETIRHSRTKRRYKKYILKNDHIIIDSILMKIEQADIEFEEGAIKNIFVDMKPVNLAYQAPLIRFRNNIPITVSGKFDPFKFANHTIFIGNHEPLGELLRAHYHELYKDSMATVDVNSFLINVNLAKLIDYKVSAVSGNEDYSPADCVIRLDGLQSVIELKKEKRSKILSARAFTDVVGLDSDQPNGLVQIEVSKKVNLSTIRKQNRQSRLVRNSYSGMLTSIEPRLVISKIEDNNRYIPVKLTDIDTTPDKNIKVSQMDVLRYQNWSFGLDLNLFKINMPDLKSNLQLNGFYHYGRSLAQDSLSYSDSLAKWITTAATHITRINTHNFGVGAMFEIRPDSRYGFSFGYDLRWLNLQSEGITYNTNQGDLKNAFQTAWFNAFIYTGTDTKLFFRFRKHWSFNEPKQTFYQLQTGVAFDIFKSK